MYTLPSAPCNSVRSWWAQQPIHPYILTPACMRTPDGLSTVVNCGLVCCQRNTHYCVWVSLWYDISGVTASCAPLPPKGHSNMLGGRGHFILSVCTAGAHPMPLLENGIDKLCTSPISVCLPIYAVDDFSMYWEMGRRLMLNMRGEPEAFNNTPFIIYTVSCILWNSVWMCVLQYSPLKVHC